MVQFSTVKAETKPGEGTNLTEVIMLWPAASDHSRESVLLSLIRMILCRLIPSMKIKNLYSKMRFQDHSELIDHEMLYESEM